jgi:hypothetical protein
MRQQDIMAPAHLIEITRQVEGEHHLLAGVLRMRIDDTHDGPYALLEGAAGPVRLQFVVLDEVDPGFAECLRQGRGFVRSEADTGLDDRTDQRAVEDAAEPAGTGDRELGARIACRKSVRQPYVEQTDSRHLFELEEIAGHGS